MIIRDLIVVVAVVITILLGIGLRLKKVTDIRWNMMYVLPTVIGVIHFFVSNRNIFMYLVYFAALLELVLLFLCKKKVLPAIISVVLVVFAVIPLVLTIITNSNCYTSLGYVDAFAAFHEDMKARYALQDWKETDFDAKYAEYIDLFEEAEQNHDKTSYTLAMLSYPASYQDGHVQMWDMYEFYGLGSTRNIQNTYAEIYKNYYGMTLIQLDSGEYVAANVEKGSSAEKAGIKNGTVVTKWNGIDIAEQLEQMKYIIPVNCSMFADSENIERFKPFCLSCMGEELIEVEFLDEQRNSKKVTLDSMGNGYPYLYHTIGLFLQKDGSEEADFHYCTLENGVGYLQVKGMGTDYDGIRSKIEGYIAQMKKEKISSLIIDVPIYLLVNSNCISAGEGFAYNMAKLPQVTIVGIQGTNGSFGTINGIDMMPEGMMGVYPSIACLDEDGEVMIDSKYHGTGGIKPDVVIPVNQKAVKEIFSEDYDYELEYLLQNIIYEK